MRRRSDRPRGLRGASLAGGLVLLIAGGCASQPQMRVSDADPLEPVNRAIYQFNDVADTFVLRPVARGYEWLLPQFMRTGVGNFFDNLNTPRHIVNNFLQGKPREGLSDAARLLMNTTLGIGGLLDPATDAGLAQHVEDMGQSFGIWGLPQGPYLVVPILGPRTTRHAIGTLGDWLYHPQRIAFGSSVRDKLNILWLVHTRSTLLGVDEEVSRAFDEYAFVRDAYLQNRAFLLYDGQPPNGAFEQEGLDDFEALEEFEDAVDEPGASPGAAL